MTSWQSEWAAHFAVDCYKKHQEKFQEAKVTGDEGDRNKAFRCLIESLQLLAESMDWAKLSCNEAIKSNGGHPVDVYLINLLHICGCIFATSTQIWPNSSPEDSSPGMRMKRYIAERVEKLFDYAMKFRNTGKFSPTAEELVAKIIQNDELTLTLICAEPYISTYGKDTLSVSILPEEDGELAALHDVRNALSIIARLNSETVRYLVGEKPKPKDTNSSSENIQTCSENPVSKSETSYNSKKILVKIGSILVILGITSFVSLINQANQTKQNPNTLTSEPNQQPQLTPQQVAQQYYELATSDREGAKALLSDAYKNFYKQNNADNGTKSFWNTVDKVDVYNVETLSQSSNSQRIKVWLKYFAKDGAQSCESQELEVTLDESKALWLINKTENAEQKLDCGF